jgi:hypothetical protein
VCHAVYSFLLRAVALAALSIELTLAHRHVRSFFPVAPEPLSFSTTVPPAVSYTPSIVQALRPPKARKFLKRRLIISENPIEVSLCAQNTSATIRTTTTMTENEKTTFGATIEPRPASLAPSADPYVITPTKTDSSLIDAPPSPLSATSSIPSHKPANPFNNLYNHSDESKTTTDLKQARGNVVDLEAQRDLSLVRTESSRPTCSNKEDSMWPSLKAQKAKAKQEKRAKSCNPLARMGKKQKLIATLVIAFFIIGAAVGIGVGISKAVGGGVTKVGGGTRTIGNGNDGQNKR